METVLDRVHSGEARILVGTQMLTKGHHFPEVSLVVILDADQGLFASDFRATERLAQTITQVAGRAGRAARPGEVMIQTQFPEHPLLTRLIAEGYEGFAAAALEERRAASWPPYSRLALLRAEAKDNGALNGFLRAAADLGRQTGDPSVTVSGPATALMARRADHFAPTSSSKPPPAPPCSVFSPAGYRKSNPFRARPGCAGASTSIPWKSIDALYLSRSAPAETPHPHGHALCRPKRRLNLARVAARAAVNCRPFISYRMDPP